MPTATVSSKNQITLPVSITRQLGIQAGDKVAIEVIGREIIIVPEPDSWVQHFKGSMRGIYTQGGQTVQRYVAEERASWETGPSDTREWLKRFEDLYYTDGTVRTLADTLLEQPDHVATLTELEGLVSDGGASLASRRDDGALVASTLTRLTAQRWVRRISAADPAADHYRLDREIAAVLLAA